MGLVAAAHGGSHFFHLTLPAVLPWLLPDLNTSATEVGVLLSLLFVISGFGQAAAGVVVDRHGGAKVLIAGLWLLAAGAAAAAVATSVWGLLPAVVLIGLGNAVFHPADYAILSHKVAPARLGRAFGMHTVGGSVGWGLAPLLLPALAAWTDWRVAVLFAAAVAAALALACTLRRFDLETPRQAQAAPSATPWADYLEMALRRPILLCFSFFALQAFALMGVQSFMPLVLHETRGVAEVAAGFTVSAWVLGSVIGNLTGGWLADAWAKLEATIIAGLLVAAGLVLVMGGVDLPLLGFTAVACVAGFALGITTPSRDLVVRSVTSAGATGRTFGFVYAGLDLGATLAPPVLGWLIDGGRGAALFTLVACVIVLAAATVVGVRRGDFAQISSSGAPVEGE